LVTFETDPFTYQATATTFTNLGITANQFSAVINPAIPSGNISMAASTGLLSGTPDVGDSNSYIVTITVANNRGSSSVDIQLFIVTQVLVGNTPIVITSPLKSVGIEGCPYTYQIVAPGATAFSPATGADPDVLGSSMIMTQGVTVSQSVIQSFAGLTGQVTVNPPFSFVPANGDTFVILDDFSVGAVIGTNVIYNISAAPDPNDPTQNQLPL